MGHTKGMLVVCLPLLTQAPENPYLTSNSPTYNECPTQSVHVLTLLRERAHHDNSTDTPQPICECQVDFPLMWIKAYPGLS